MREPLVRGPLHQLELAHADLAFRITRIAPDRPDRRFEEHLRVPVVRFEEQQLPPRLQQAVERGEVLGVGVVAQDGGADDVIEALFGKVAEFVEADNAGVGQPPRLGLHRKILVEHGGCERVLASQRDREVLGPETAPRTELENRLTGQDVKAVTHRQRPPAELHRRRRGIAAPVGFAGALHRAEVRLERHDAFRHTRRAT